MTLSSLQKLFIFERYVLFLILSIVNTLETGIGHFCHPTFLSKSLGCQYNGSTNLEGDLQLLQRIDDGYEIRSQGHPLIGTFLK